MGEAVDSDCNGCKKRQHDHICFFDAGIVLEEQNSCEQDQENIADMG